jgi:tetratricopeptide (TPR) repeat protein
MKKNTIFLVLILSFLSFGLWGQNAKQFLKTGDEFLKVNKFEDAIQQYSKALEIESDLTKAYTQRAFSYSQLSRFKEAAEDYDRASVFIPKDETNFYNAADMYYRIDNNQSSLERLNKSLEINNRFIEAFQLKVLVLLNLKKNEEALEAAKTALRLKESSENYFVYAKVNESLNNLDIAAESYLTAFEKNDKYVEAAIRLAEVQRKQKKYNLAISYINRAIRQDPGSVEAYLIRSDIYADQLQYQSAINDISNVVNITSHLPSILMPFLILIKSFPSSLKMQKLIMKELIRMSN